MAAVSGRRELLISKGWVQAVALVVLFGSFVLGLLAYRTYTGQFPIPWPHFEAGRSHRGISLAITLVAGLTLIRGVLLEFSED